MIRNVVFVAPFFLDTTMRFLRAAVHHPNAQVALISQDPLERLPGDLRARIVGHRRLRDGLNTDRITDAVADLSRTGPVHRLLGTLEQLQEPLGAVRDRLGLPGMRADAARRFRDKALMKETLRAAGIPCARHRTIRQPQDAWDFIDAVGYPVVIKPPDGAGAKATFMVEDAEALRQALRANPPRPDRPLLGEEFIQGEEHSFDGVSLGGRLIWHSLTHYEPTPLEAVRNPWIQWCILLPREIDHPQYNDIRSVASRALQALGMGTGVSHLEWFRRRDGTIAISEVGARPGGVQISKLISYAHHMDFYRAWARVMIDGQFDPPVRRYAAGAAFLRGQGKGRVRAIHGLEAAQKTVGPLVIESNLPRIGVAPTGSYEGEGYAILRHPETDVVRRALKTLISVVRVELG